MSPVTDLVIRIKNGYMAKKYRITSPYSKFREAVLTKLKKLKYIDDFTVSGEVVKTFTIDLVSDDSNKFNDVKIISKPGQRMYIPVNELKPVMSGMGYAIISTPNGILTNIEAKKQNTGGELLFYIW
jgi:small subunit ribosomal protein S8